MVEKLRNHYVTNDISLADLADTSASLIGQHVSVDQLKRASIKGRWNVLKVRARYGKAGLPNTSEEEADDIRAVVFDSIMDPENPPSARDLASLIGAYMDLRKMGGLSAAGAKTDRQKILDMIAEHAGGRQS